MIESWWRVLKHQWHHLFVITVFVPQLHHCNDPMDGAAVSQSSSQSDGIALV